MRRIIPILFVCLLAAACSSIECPLNNRVYTNYVVVGDTLTDTLTISTTRVDDHTDTVLINKQENTTSYSIPISYQLKEDIFYYEFRNALGISTMDTVWVEKKDFPHFESVDCNPQFFHELISVRHTFNRIDRIEIIEKNVTYDKTKEHFHIYFKNID